MNSAYDIIILRKSFRFTDYISISYPFFRKEYTMYESPKAERLIPESEDVLNLDLLLASTENDESDNTTSIDDLLGGLL